MGSTHPRGLEMLTGATRDLSETRYVRKTGERAPCPGTQRDCAEFVGRVEAAGRSSRAAVPRPNCFSLMIQPLAHPANRARRLP